MGHLSLALGQANESLSPVLYGAVCMSAERNNWLERFRTRLRLQLHLAAMENGSIEVESQPEKFMASGADFRIEMHRICCKLLSVPRVWLLRSAVVAHDVGSRCHGAFIDIGKQNLIPFHHPRRRRAIALPWHACGI